MSIDRYQDPSFGRRVAEYAAFGAFVVATSPFLGDKLADVVVSDASQTVSDHYDVADNIATENSRLDTPRRLEVGRAMQIGLADWTDGGEPLIFVEPATADSPPTARIADNTTSSVVADAVRDERSRVRQTEVGAPFAVAGAEIFVVGTARKFSRKHGPFLPSLPKRRIPLRPNTTQTALAHPGRPKKRPKGRGGRLGIVQTYRDNRAMARQARRGGAEAAALADRHQKIAEQANNLQQGILVTKVGPFGGRKGEK